MPVKCAHLGISQLREGVDDDTEDDVEADGGDEDEEGHVIHHQGPETGEGAALRVHFDLLQGNQSRHAILKSNPSLLFINFHVH